VENFIASFSGSNRFILDFLIEEVLSQQPAEIQNFLIWTSILDQVCSHYATHCSVIGNQVFPMTLKRYWNTWKTATCSLLSG